MTLMGICRVKPPGGGGGGGALRALAPGGRAGRMRWAIVRIVLVDRSAAPIRHHDGLPRTPPPRARPAATVVTTTMAQCTVSRGARRLVALVGFHARMYRYAGSAAGRGDLRGVCVAYAGRVGPAAGEGARVSLPPTAGACGEVSPTVVRAGRRRRPRRACGRAVDRGPR
ncbi:hypothetical protein BU14_0505s0004 [Porphyra umbilicalis]|uniref:Uncharacterized protein n=1 Tax=Porphyra umbilicalis TaxID=2786 RepID=A0A1X6NSZ2_PORUM|nr:hypothetical protein BU14_0505s0004 [Porphyra umbilicalis]|eukprot:OSX71724.1 hypothetical protein BU14_0505s0004 [Porphyra umbilicalis]